MAEVKEGQGENSHSRLVYLEKSNEALVIMFIIKLLMVVV